MRPACGRRPAVRFFYLSHGLVQVFEIELSHMGKNKEKQRKSGSGVRERFSLLLALQITREISTLFLLEIYD